MNSKFQTHIEIPEYKWKTGYHKMNIFIGSCFTENIGGKMKEMKFQADINPFGILYNPVSVANALKFLTQKKKFTKQDLIYHDGLWHSFFHHGRFSSPNAGKTLAEINKRIDYSSDILQKAEFLFLTFGTSRVYEYKATGQIVSNCHKIPEKEFKRFRLDPDQILKKYIMLLPEIIENNPGLKIIFSVSPVRHWRDGAIENQRSKASLILAVDKIINHFGKDRCDYFPGYEILMDELRDYRFYSEDMIHLSDAAVNHIWDIFQENMIDDESKQISAEIKKIISASTHKPFNKYTKEHLAFLKSSLKNSVGFHKKFPYINVTYEKNYFSNEIAEIKKVIK
jgi:hypothetical protein